MYHWWAHQWGLGLNNDIYPCTVNQQHKWGDKKSKQNNQTKAPTYGIISVKETENSFKTKP